MVFKGLVVFCPADSTGDAHTMLLADCTARHFTSFEILLVDGMFEFMQGCPLRCFAPCELITGVDNGPLTRQVRALWTKDT